MSDKNGVLFEQLQQGDRRALARFLTVLENEGPTVLSVLPEILTPKRQAFRVGITGPPGAGKSTLIGQIIGELRARGLTVGVMAVDPSSPFSKGAVLGDRIRYTEHFQDPGVFIRSLGTRGSLGGLSSSAYLMVRAFDCAGFDVVLLETVGVGQTELEVMNVADYVSVVLVPESGDAIQTMKAGLLEIADLFVVNKADRPGAESFARELENSIQIGVSFGNKQIDVISTVATQNRGLHQLVDKILAVRASADWKERRETPPRLQAEGKALLRQFYEFEIEKKVASVLSSKQLADLFVLK